MSLPVRPIVVAGDDLTLVCDARLALPLVRYALDWLDADPDRIGDPADPADPRVALHRALDHDGRGPRRSVRGRHTTCVPTVGVGLAIQPVGAPLSLGYDVCEALCSRAKARRVARPEGEDDDHVVAWTTGTDGVERALERLDRRGTLPLTGSELHAFLSSHLDAHAPGSLLPGGTPRERGWLHSTLVPLLESGADPEPELLRRERATGRDVDLPRGWTPGGLLDAVEVMDLHLDPGLAAALDPHRPQPQGRTGAGGPTSPNPTSGGPAP